jgi:glucose/mannose transport system permease protein
MTTQATAAETSVAASRARSRFHVRWGRVVLYAVAIAFVAFYLLPVYLLLLTSLKSYQEVDLYKMWSLPKTLGIDSFLEAWNGSAAVQGLAHNFVNSLYVTIVATAVSCLWGSWNGYILTKWKFRGADIIFPLILFGMFIPYQSILIPLVATLNYVHLGGTLEGLILVHIIYGIPPTALMFRSYFATIPNEVVEASRIDGAHLFGIYWHIMLPLAAPAFVVTGIWQFTNIWNDFLFAITIVNNPANQPVTVALNNLAGSFTVQWNVQMAAALLAALPTLLVYIFLGRYFLRGLMAGSLKG